MPADSALLLVALFVVAAAAGWFFARMTKPGGGEQRKSENLSSDYFEGLNFLLNEQPDKALEVFVRMVDVDSDTIETHFALGNLFRRRGEVYRAIRIHQNIVDRPELPRAQRDQALRALADDYLKAGLLDRAETILLQLADGSSTHQVDALNRLVSIYEQERDWEKAIQTRDRLAALSPEGRSPIAAHYYCELAEEALKRDDVDAARQALRHARSADKSCTRGRLLRARLAAEEGDHRLAARLYTRVLKADGAFAPLVLPPLRRAYAAMGDEEGFARFIAETVRERPELQPGVAYAAIVDGNFDDPATSACIRAFVRQNPVLEDLLDILRPDRADREADTQSVRRITEALRRLSGRGPSYRCENCGFAGGTLFWQCPTCKSWDTTRPVAYFRFEAVLDTPSQPDAA
jgi:lipopolysaccharide biosynthesis regulator YciM